MRSMTIIAAFTLLTLTACAEGAPTGSGSTDSLSEARTRIASVTIVPAPASVTVGSTVQLISTVRDGAGRVLTGRTVTWTSSDTTIARVSATGVVTGIRAGSSTVRATVSRAVGSSVVTVNAAPPPSPAPVASVAVSPNASTIAVGASLQLTATPRDASGVPLSGRAVAWTSSNLGVATVSTTGVVTAVAAGSAIITAASEGLNGTGSISVPVPAPPAPVPVATIGVSPSTGTVPIGQSLQLSATTKDANGITLTGRTVTWTSSNAQVGTVSNTGLVSALGSGTTTITATSEGRSGTATVTVPQPPPPTPAPVASVTVSPASASVLVGQTVQLTATPKDASGASLTGRMITWASSNTSIATVSGNGLVSGAGPGSATITATSEGKSATATVAVSSPPASVVDTIFYEGFESGSLSAWQDEAKPQNHALITTSGNVYAGSRALQITYPANDDGGWLTRFFMPGYDSVFVRMRIKLDASWTGGTKLAYLAGSRIDNQWSAFGQAGKCPNGSDFFNAFLYGQVAPQMSVHFYTYFPGMPRESDGSCYGVDGPSSGYTPDGYQISTGVWHSLELWVKVNAPGQANGAQQFWLDGQLRGSWSGITFRTTTDLRLNSFTISPNTPFTTGSVRKMYIDDVVITRQKLEP